MRIAALTLIALLTSCAVESNTASQVPTDGGQARTFSDGKTYTRIDNCAPLLGSDAAADPAYNSPPHGMALAVWQQIVLNIYAGERRVDQACLEKRLFMTTLTGQVTRYKILDP